MKPNKEVQDKLFYEIDIHKDSLDLANQNDIETLYHIMIHDLGASQASKILKDAGFYDHLNVDCKLDYDKWIYVDKKDNLGHGRNSFNNITWKLLYEMKNEYEKFLNNKN